MKDNKSLAQYIVEHREKRGLSTLGLAAKAAVSLKDLEDIESGQVLFLPSTIRQKIAHVLKVSIAEIKEHEKQIDVVKNVSDNYIDQLKELIIKGEVENLLCPICHSRLICKVEEMFDLEDNLVLEAKAHCSKCSFIIK